MTAQNTKDPLYAGLFKSIRIRKEIGFKLLL